MLFSTSARFLSLAASRSISLVCNVSSAITTSSGGNNVPRDSSIVDDVVVVGVDE